MNRILSTQLPIVAAVMAFSAAADSVREDELDVATDVLSSIVVDPLCFLRKYSTIRDVRKV